jgi:NAD(P)-dependent dehydrogenase (short-subunit alcohol dehydrogenase family)
MSGVVVSGGASGIGRACAESLLAEGRDVFLWDLSPSVIEVAESMKMTGLVVDVTDEAAVAAAIEQSAAALDGIDGYVHAAGTVSADPLGALTRPLWDKVVDVNLVAHALVVQALLPHLRAATNAAVVGISSIEGLVGNAAIPAYCASKGGLLALSRQMAAQLGPEGIRSNCVCPGFIDTPLLPNGPGFEALREGFAKAASLGRIGRPAEIGDAVAFLLSPKASFINGAELVVDGGNISMNH